MKIMNNLTKAAIVSSLFLLYAHNSFGAVSPKYTPIENSVCRKTDFIIDSLTKFHFEIILGSEKNSVRTAIWVNRIDLSYIITKTNINSEYTCIVENSSSNLYINNNAIKDIAATIGKKK